MRPALPSADVWNTLASCDPGVPATEPQRGVKSVHEGDDMFDEGLWGEDWAEGSSGTGALDLVLVQPSAAAASGTFAGHDRATALRLLAKVNFQLGLSSSFTILSLAVVCAHLSPCCIKEAQGISR